MGAISDFCTIAGRGEPKGMSIWCYSWREITPTARRQAGIRSVLEIEKKKVATVLRMRFYGLCRGLVGIDQGVDEFAIRRPCRMNGVSRLPRDGVDDDAA